MPWFCELQRRLQQPRIRHCGDDVIVHRTRSVKIARLAILVLLTATSVASFANGTTRAGQMTVSVLWDDAMTNKQAAVWMGYLFARVQYVSRHAPEYPNVPGVVQARFEEEVHARSEAVEIYRDIRARKPDMATEYFDSLERVHAAGFMREYVWRYLKRPEWQRPAGDLRETEFDRWSREHLTNHQAETRGRVALAAN